MRVCVHVCVPVHAAWANLSEPPTLISFGEIRQTGWCFVGLDNPCSSMAGFPARQVDVCT